MAHPDDARTSGYGFRRKPAPRFGLGDAMQHRRLVARRYRVLTWSFRTVAQTPYPFRVAQFESYVQLTYLCRMLSSQGCFTCAIFLLLSCPERYASF